MSTLSLVPQNEPSTDYSEGDRVVIIVQQVVLSDASEGEGSHLETTVYDLNAEYGQAAIVVADFVKAEENPFVNLIESTFTVPYTE